MCHELRHLINSTLTIWNTNTYIYVRYKIYHIKHKYIYMNEQRKGGRKEKQKKGREKERVWMDKS